MSELRLGGEGRRGVEWASERESCSTHDLFFFLSIPFNEDVAGGVDDDLLT